MSQGNRTKMSWRPLVGFFICRALYSWKALRHVTNPEPLFCAILPGAGVVVRIRVTRDTVIFLSVLNFPIHSVFMGTIRVSNVFVLTSAARGISVSFSVAVFPFLFHSKLCFFSRIDAMIPRTRETFTVRSFRLILFLLCSVLAVLGIQINANQPDYFES